MRTTSKLLTAGAVILAAGAFAAIATAQHGPGSGPGRMGMGPGMMKGMMGHGPMGHGPAMGAFGDPVVRLATLKTELAIKPEQTEAWDAYAKIVTATAADAKEHRAHVDRDAVRKMEPQQRQEFATGMQKHQQESFAKVKAAAEVLLTKLDDRQKATAQTSLPGLVTAGHGPGMRHGMMGGHAAGKGTGPMPNH